MPLKRYDPLAGTQYAERSVVVPAPIRIIEPPKPTPIIAVEVDRNAAIMAEIARLKAENERLRFKKMGKPTVVAAVTAIIPTPQVVEHVSNVVPMVTQPAKAMTPLEQRIAANPSAWPLWRRRLHQVK